MSINEVQDEVIAEFSDFDDWMDRYQLLIDLGNEQEPLDDKYKTEQNLIEGCQSRVWLQADEENGAAQLGQALFDLTALAQRLGVDAEQALFEACRAYIEGFEAEK